MFSTDAERLVATRLYPRLERLTFSRELPLLKDDRLFSAAYSGFNPVRRSGRAPLGFDDEDLLDEVRAVFKEIGCEASEAAFADELQGAETVGQLITALANLTSPSGPLVANC